MNKEEQELKKEFVPYTEAFELKKLGFDKPCFGWWFADEQMLIIEKSKKSTSETVAQAPTYSQAFRWFREKYDLQLWLGDGGMLSKAFVKITGYKHDKFYFSSSEPMEYEEAELYGLNQLIKIAKTKNNDL